MTDITPGTVLARSETIVSTDLGARTSMMDIEKGQYFGLEEVGARVWALLESPRSMGELRDQLVLEFDVDGAMCERELRAFLASLLENGLLRVVSL